MEEKQLEKHFVPRNPTNLEEITRTLRVLIAQKVGLVGRSKVTVEDGVIWLTGKLDKSGDNCLCFLSELCSGDWCQIPEGSPIRLRHFMINRDETTKWGDMYCAKWMMLRYGEDCLKECSIVRPRDGCVDFSRDPEPFDWIYTGRPDLKVVANIDLSE